MNLLVATVLSSKALLAETVNEFAPWLAELNATQIAIVTSLVVLVVLIRNALARLMLSALFGLTNSLSVPMSQAVRESM